jgi:hypothetical protein
MQGLRHESGHGSRCLATSLALVLASLSLVFLLQVTPHGHSNSQDEAACRLCQAAHVSAIPVVTGIVLSVPLVAVGEVAAPNPLGSTDSFLRHSDPRAPPAVVQY